MASGPSLAHLLARLGILQNVAQGLDLVAQLVGAFPIPVFAGLGALVHQRPHLGGDAAPLLHQQHQPPADRLHLVPAPLHRPDDHADQGTHTFTYALFPHSGEWYQAAVDQEAWELNDPPLVFQGATAPLGGLWQGDVPGLTFDALTVAADRGALLLRFPETEGRHARVSSQADFQFQSWCSCNLLERQEGQPHTQRELSFTLRPFELKTIKFTL